MAQSHVEQFFIDSLNRTTNENSAWTGNLTGAFTGSRSNSGASPTASTTGNLYVENIFTRDSFRQLSGRHISISSVRFRIQTIDQSFTGRLREDSVTGTILGTITHGASGQSWSSWTTVTAPTGGWTGTKLGSLCAEWVNNGLQTGNVAGFAIEVTYTTIDLPRLESYAITNSGGATVTTLELTAPSGIQAGDLLLVWGGSDATEEVATLSTNETGWTKIREEYSAAADCHVACWYKEADGTEGAFTLNSSTSDELVGCYARMSHCVTTPFDDYGQSFIPSTTGLEDRYYFHNPAVHTPSGASYPYVVISCLTTDGSDVTDPATNPLTSADDYASSWTQIDQDAAEGGGNDVGLAFAMVANADPSDPPTGTFLSNTASEGHSYISVFVNRVVPTYTLLCEPSATTQTTGYVDGSDTAVSGGSWTNVTNATDGSISTGATTTVENAFLNAYGTQSTGAPAGYSRILKVEIRFYGSVSATGGSPYIRLRWRAADDDVGPESSWVQYSSSTLGWSVYLELNPVTNISGEWDEATIDKLGIGVFANDGGGTNLSAEFRKAEIRKTYGVEIDFALTGSDATLTKNEAGGDVEMDASSGSFSVTGQAADLERALHFDASAGSFVLTGTDNAFASGYTIQAEAELFALTGIDSDTTTARYLESTAGSFVLTGTDAELLLGHVVTAEAGSFDLTGVDVAYIASVTMPAVAGSFDLTGIDVDFLLTEAMPAEVGTFTLTGNAADFQYQEIFAAEAGSFAITGVDTDLNVSVNFAAEAGAFNLTGVTADLNRALQFDAETGSVVLTGIDVDLDRALQFDAEAGSLIVTGVDVAYQLAYLFDAEAGSFVLTGTEANLERALQFDAEAGSLAITGQAADFDLTENMPASVGVFAVTGQTATLTYVSTSHEFEGYRFRDDDGSESGATWKVAQDTNITEQKGVNVRLRTLVDVTGNPDAEQITLQYRKVGDPSWKTVR